MSQKNIKPKTLAIVLGIVIIIAVGLRLQQAFQKPAPEKSPEIIVQTQKVAGRFESQVYRFSFNYPSYWQEDANSIFNNEVTRVYGTDGFAAVDAIGAPGQSIDQAVSGLTQHKLAPYGSQPVVTGEIIDGAEARFIMPSADQNEAQHGEAAMLLAYPSPFKIDTVEVQFAVIYADKNHILDIGRSVHLFTSVSENQNEIKIYLMNNKLDPEITCALAFPVKRTLHPVSGGDSEINLILEELLKGPTESEVAAGYFTTINAGVPVPAVEIGVGDQEGIVTLNFDQKLQEAVGGSCRVTAIRTQITETIKQNFSWVKEVVIEVNGNAAEALQP